MTLMLDSVKEIDIEKDGINIQLLTMKIFLVYIQLLIM